MPDNPSRWVDDIFIDYGYVWATEDDLEPVCLGREEVVMPAYHRETPIPEDMKGARRRILQEMIEERSIDRFEHSVSGPSIRRGRSLQPATRQQSNSSRAATA